MLVVGLFFNAFTILLVLALAGRVRHMRSRRRLGMMVPPVAAAAAARRARRHDLP